MSELLIEQVSQYVPFGNAVVHGLPEFLEAIELEQLMRQGEDHLLIQMRAGLSGKAHGDRTTDADKYEVPNQGFATQIGWAIQSGIWTPQANIHYPQPTDVDPYKPLGLSIPDLNKEMVQFADGEADADRIIGLGARFDGNVRRIQTIREMIEAGSLANSIAYLTGPRATQPNEGDSERYKTVDPTGSERPIEELFPTEYDQANAIMEHEFPGIEMQDVITDDSDTGFLRNHEAATIYRVPDDRYGNVEEIIVVNGMPVVQEDAVNRPKAVANPRAPETFEEYLRVFGIESGAISYVSSYPHRNRIAIEGLMKVVDMGRADGIRLYPQGKMSWPDKVTAGLHAGEVEPMMRLTRQLLEKAGLPANLIPRTRQVVQTYLQTH
jgi:hypothetical protein